MMVSCVVNSSTLRKPVIRADSVCEPATTTCQPPLSTLNLPSASVFLLPSSFPLHLTKPLIQPQLPIERLPARFPPQETLQRLHLLLAPALLQHLMPVPPSLRPVHGVLGEDAVEHVGAVDLAAEVAVIASVVAAD